MEPKCKAPITIGAIGASGFYPLVVNSVAAILSQHAENSSPLTEKNEPPCLDTEEHEKRRRGGQFGKPRHVLKVHANTFSIASRRLGLRVKVGVFLQNVIYVCNLQ